DDQLRQALTSIVRASESADDGRAAERVLFVRYQRNGDMAAREELVKRFLPLARRLARRYERASEPLEDLVQVASVGLVKAIDRFETEQGTGFSSYAVPTILGELKRHFRDSGWALHVPRGMQEKVLKVNEAVEHLSGELGRSPSPQQRLADARLAADPPGARAPARGGWGGPGRIRPQAAGFRLREPRRPAGIVTFQSAAEPRMPPWK